MTIHKVAVVGAGNMGSGIAQKIASSGVAVLLVDATQERADAGKQRIEATLQEGVERRLFSPEQVTSILQRVHPTGDMADIANVDLVIEAVFEDLKVKQDLFEQLSQTCRQDTILATNTSSFLVEDVASVAKGPERVIGLHYFYHPAKNRLVEVIGHQGSDPAVVERAAAFQERIGKTVIRSEDAPGFVVNRFFVPWLNEAIRLHEEGHAIAAIEGVAKDVFGIGMGPFELMNVTGVPITLHAATSLAERLGEFYAPASILAPKVESGSPWDLGDPQEAGPGGAEQIAERLWGCVLHVAAQLVSEGVASLEATDIGARVGLRWPEGPFEMFNGFGSQKAQGYARSFAERYDLVRPSLLVSQEATGSCFELKRVELHVDRGIGTVLINRPDKLNALDPETVRQLTERFTEAEGRDDVEAIVIAGAGKAFVAGADVKFFVDKIQADAIDDIVAFTEAGQALFRKIETCSKRVIGRLDGLALGGGGELALACHVLVATPNATMAFPETGIGIYPGLGGTQRLTRRLGLGLSRYYLYTGNGMGAEEMAAFGLAWRVVEADELDATIREAVTAAPVRPQLNIEKLSAGHQAVSAFLDGVSVTDWLAGTPPTPESLSELKLNKKVSHKAPQALISVEKLTAVATATDMDAGLAEEMRGLRDIFGTADALEGLSSVLERRRPTFSGQ